MRRCACGHDRAAHEHYRAGSDCGRCGCRRLRRAWPWQIRRATDIARAETTLDLARNSATTTRAQAAAAEQRLAAMVTAYNQAQRR